MKLVPEILARNWQLKLSAVALAVLLWTVPRFEAQSRQVLDAVPVRVQLTDPHFALEGDPLPSRVRVSISGPARELFALAVDQPSVVVPVDQVVARDTAVLLRLPWVRIPDREGVIVEAIEPSSVQLRFERMEVVGVPLAVRFAGELPDSLAFSRPPVLSDSLVRVSGPSSRVSVLDSIPLIPLDLSRLSRSGTLTQPVDTAGLNGLAISLQATLVELFLEEAVDTVFANFPVEWPVNDLGSEIQVRPQTVTVTLSGAGSLLAMVQSDQLRVVLRPVQSLRLSPGEERRVRLAVEGVPPLVRATSAPEWVTLRRAVGS